MLYNDTEVRSIRKLSRDITLRARGRDCSVASHRATPLAFLGRNNRSSIAYFPALVNLGFHPLNYESGHQTVRISHIRSATALRRLLRLYSAAFSTGRRSSVASVSSSVSSFVGPAKHQLCVLYFSGDKVQSPAVVHVSSRLHSHERR